MCTATGQVILGEAKDRDQVLIEKAQAGNRRAFEELIFKYDRRILGLALRLLRNRDDARDAYQETFTKAFRAIGRFRGQSTFYTWILRIATNVCYDRLQERTTSLDTLSTDERLIFELKHYQGLKLKQVGELLGTSENGIKNHLWSATQKLRLKLAGNE